MITSTSISIRTLMTKYPFKNSFHSQDVINIVILIVPLNERRTTLVSSAWKTIAPNDAIAFDDLKSIYY